MKRSLKWVLVGGLTMFTVPAGAAPPARNVASACRGVADAELQVGLLTDPRNVLAVEEIKPQESMTESEPSDQRAGARIVLVARAGMTAEWLQRIVECHLAQNAARGYPSAAQSPLD